MDTDPLLDSSVRLTRRHIERVLLHAYVQQFLFIRSGYSFIIVAFLICSICLNFIFVPPIVGANISYQIGKAVSITIGIMFCTCHNAGPITKSIYTGVYVFFAAIGPVLCITNYIMLGRNQPYVCMITLFITAVDITRLLYYGFLYQRANGGSIQALNVNYDDYLTSRKVQYKLGEEYQDGMRFGTDPCVICLEDYEEGTMLSVLDCGHYYHTSCIGKWLPRVNTCPVCRARVDAVAAELV